MLSAVFDPTMILVALGAGVLAFAAGSIVGGTRNEGGRALLRGLEAGLLAVVGGVLAHGLVGTLLQLGGDTNGAGLAVGWFFLFVPGAVDTVPALFGSQPLTQPDRLAWIALGVGAFAGAMDGIWKVHDWTGEGVLSALLDYTWGLAGTTISVLLHLVNLFWDGHVDEPRTGAHRYSGGFRFKGGYAVTLGPVMSNTGSGPGSSLYEHEMLHVWQNRAFGPFFSLSYVGWMVVMFVPGLVAGARASAVGRGIEDYCYVSNPWEVWAYSHGGGSHTSPGSLALSGGTLAAVAVPYYLVLLAVYAVVVWSVWL